VTPQRSTSDLSALTLAPGLARNQSLHRAIALLRVLAARPAGTSAPELARATGLPVPTTRRLLATLADEGFVERRSADGRFLLGQDLVRLALSADPWIAVVPQALPVLERLVADVGETAMLAAARLPAVHVIAQVDAPRTLRVASWVGRSFPLYASAGARLPLAMLEDEAVAALVGPGPYPRLAAGARTTLAAVLDAVRETRATGVAEGADELEDGLATVAVPVGHAAADGLFLGLYGPTSRLDARRRRELVPTIRAAAADIATTVARSRTQLEGGTAA
jgi:IclR family transcriptional regulator, acetate operon repressor